MPPGLILPPRSSPPRYQWSIPSQARRASEATKFGSRHTERERPRDFRDHRGTGTSPGDSFHHLLYTSLDDGLKLKPKQATILHLPAICSSHPDLSNWSISFDSSYVGFSSFDLPISLLSCPAQHFERSRAAAQHRSASLLSAERQEGLNVKKNNRKREQTIRKDMFSVLSFTSNQLKNF